MNILVCDNFSPEALEILKNTEGVTLDYRPSIEPEELRSAIVGADALLVRGGTEVDSELLDAADNLRIIARAGIGVENIDMQAANQKGVVVTNTPSGSTTTMAEHTIAMMLALARRIPQASQAVKQGIWDSTPFNGSDIHGKTLGIIGGGKIARRVIEFARGLSMDTILYDPYLSAEVIKNLGARKVSLNQLLESVDFLSLHVPLNMETEEMLSASAFERLKPGCHLINCASGRLINEQDLVDALNSGIVAGAALDAFAVEPPDINNPLLHMDKVISTPHLRAATEDAQANVTRQAATQVLDFLQRGVVNNALNVPSVNADQLKTLWPYLNLAERLGSFLAQLLKKPFSSISIEYAGSIINHPTEPMSMAALKGLLTSIIGSRVNYVNARHIIEKRGIEVTETRTNVTNGYSNTLTLRIHGEEGAQSVSGALFLNRECRIIRVDGYQVENIPEGTILVVNNLDKPGVLALIGRVLEEADINVAMMNLSRRENSGKAVSLLTVDQSIPDTVMEQLRQDPRIISARQVTLPPMADELHPLSTDTLK
ncbi:MAG: phosphoglycerate dehydrogenase [Desulfuromonadaceae bacterium]